MKYTIFLCVGLVFSLFSMETLSAQVSVCEDDSFSISATGNNPSTSYTLTYVLVCGGTVTTTNTTGTFDMSTLGVSAGSSCTVYAVDHDTAEDFSTWPTPVSSCTSSISQAVTVTAACTSLSVCETDVLTISAAGNNPSANYTLSYVLVCGGSVTSVNTTGMFDMGALSVSAGSNCTVYAVDHDAAEDFSTWPTPVSSCVSSISQPVTVTAGPCSTVSLAPKVFLQGPLSGSTMATDLAAATLIPTTDPYDGSKTATTAVLSTMVDWVWVEVRDAATGTMVLAAQPGLLQPNGCIVDTDGSSALVFPLAIGSYHVVVKHRNHLSVMTGSPVNLN